jgi:hypothetical protein
MDCRVAALLAMTKNILIGSVSIWTETALKRTVDVAAV